MPPSIRVRGDSNFRGYWWYKVELKKDTLNGGMIVGWVGAADHDGSPWLVNVDDYYGGGCDVDPGMSFLPGDMPCLRLLELPAPV